MHRVSTCCITMFASGLYVQPLAAGDRVAPEDFAILPWGWSSGDVAVFEEIKACGFNLAGFVAPDKLDTVAQAGLKCIVSDRSISATDKTAELNDEQITRCVRAVADKVRDHPATFGYYLRDEPSARMYPTLARWADAVRRADPDAVPYINLFPNYANREQLGTETYAQYLESFISIVKPPFVSYDHYALMQDGTLRSGYFQNLEAVRAAALKHDLPFWNIVLGNAHFTYTEPSPAGLRFQAYTTLAYGARGLSYFTYFMSTTGNYRLAPIDQFGNKTPTWDMMRRVNLQIHKLAPTYITLESVNVFHHPNVPDGCRGIDTSRHIKSVSGGDFVVGEFEGPKGEPFVLVVNKDLHKSINFAMEFKTAGPVIQTNSYTGRQHAWRGENNWLAAGQGMLLHTAP